MKKGFRLLTVLSAIMLLVSGCGTPLHEMTDDEENIVVRYAAYAVGKHNIRQKDGMTSDMPQEKDTQNKEKDNAKADSGKASQTDGAAGENGVGDGEEQDYEVIELSDAVDCRNGLSIGYQNYEIKDSYKEGNYFSVNAAEGNTLLIMHFVISNPTDGTLKYDTSGLTAKFYGVFDGTNRIAEKVTFSNEELSSSTKTVKAGKKTGAIMIFELSKEQSKTVDSLTVLVDKKEQLYQVKLKNN